MEPNRCLTLDVRLIDVQTRTTLRFRLEETEWYLKTSIIRLPKRYRVEPALPEEVLQCLWEINTHLTRPTDELVEGDVSILQSVQSFQIDRPNEMTSKEVITARLTERSLKEGLIGVYFEPEYGQETNDSIIGLSDYDYVITEYRPTRILAVDSPDGETHLAIDRRHDTTKY